MTKRSAMQYYDDALLDIGAMACVFSVLSDALESSDDPGQRQLSSACYLGERILNQALLNLGEFWELNRRALGKSDPPAADA